MKLDVTRQLIFVPILLAFAGSAPGAAGQPSVGPPVETTRVQSLDGAWQLVLDPKDAGKSQAWFKAGGLPADGDRSIQVPGSIVEVDPGYEGVFWCGRSFTPSVAYSRDLRHYLRFGAVAYACDVWLNGTLLGSHEGAQSPFEFDVTKTLVPGKLNHLTLRITGPFVAVFGGINQHVTLVAQPVVRIQDVFAQGDFDAGRIRLHVALENKGDVPAELALEASYGEWKPRKNLGVVAAKTSVARGSAVTTLLIPIEKPHRWDLDDPFLYAIRLTSDWPAAGSPAARRDIYCLRSGFRDFRIVDGYFHLNGKRIYLKSAHSNWYDPIAIYGTPRTMNYLSRDFALMKSAGFNMFRFIVAAALPEQLDQADELGFLIYSEHETSWPALYKPGTRFGVSLNDVVRRDRNHPSLVIWGLLNETPPGNTYNSAKAWLPSLRAIDETRLVLLSSGRWDVDLKTGSASNPGSRSWDVYLGGEDAVKPVSAGGLPTDIGAYRGGVGDAHVYQSYPTTWNFITAFSELGRTTRPVFLSEAGLGSSYNALRDQRKMRQAGAAKDAYAWRWIAPAVQNLQQAWDKYHLETLYPSIEEMLVDSELNAARQREIMFNIVRSNPRVNSYSLTSVMDAWGLAEGVMDGFREFKPGHLAILRAGWAKLRWCLFVNPMHVYSDAPMRLKVALASEDALPAGAYPVTLRITGRQGALWQKAVTITIPAGEHPPLAYTALDEDVAVAGLAEGTYSLSAVFDNRDNAASHELSFFVSERSKQPRNLGPITVLGVNPPVRTFLTAHGAVLREFAAKEQRDRDVILVGDTLAGGAAAWRALYARVACGAHAVFLSPAVFSNGKAANHWLAVQSKGDQVGRQDWLYHKDIVAKPHPLMAGLQTRIMTPDYYAEVLANTRFFRNTTPPDDTVAVAIHCTMGDGAFECSSGVMLGTYRHHAGRFTLNTLNLLSNLGHPAADRLLLNLLAHARSTVAVVQPLPANYEAEIRAMGIAD
ncbi:MAG: glycoside hydrolase family 2 TIM barrel-domain containing protein [Thermoguttaceae bacterium]